MSTKPLGGAQTSVCYDHVFTLAIERSVFSVTDTAFENIALCIACLMMPGMYEGKKDERSNLGRRRTPRGRGSKGICELYHRVGPEIRKSIEPDELTERLDPGSTQGRPRVDPVSSCDHVII